MKCVDRDKDSNKHVLNIPKTTGRMARISILCSDNEDRSFIAEEDGEGRADSVRGESVRGSRVIERKSVEKQRMSAEVKVLTNKI